MDHSVVVDDNWQWELLAVAVAFAGSSSIIYAGGV
jgi:hypothetical protein